MIVPRKRIIAVGVSVVLASALAGCAGRHNLCRQCESPILAAGISEVQAAPVGLESPGFVASRTEVSAVPAKSMGRVITFQDLVNRHFDLAAQVHTLENRIDELEKEN